MKYCVGIDLGSTTTKAVVLGEDGHPLGHGITNSRSNYAVACAVALGEALINARFGLISSELDEAGVDPRSKEAWLSELERRFREEQYRAQLGILVEVMDSLQARPDPSVGTILEKMRDETASLFTKGATRKSDFFRDLAGSRFVAHAEQLVGTRRGGFDLLVGLFDKAILEVENRPAGADDFHLHASAALGKMTDSAPGLARAVARVGSRPMEQSGTVGTGYGRQSLPFPKEQIRSEILCHGLGAHHMFPATRTLLDIGGQDTKAIQVNDQGIVTSFQMNDRCAAGCGRYLGYIADEMNLGLHELGPLACQATRTVRINSTCTVFAGAELRERLSLGERREDILSGLHRAIILRAMSLVARSGGITNEFTFTGGVAKNPAATGALRRLVQENYGEVTINVSPDSIYTGALGAAHFAYRDWLRQAA